MPPLTRTRRLHPLCTLLSAASALAMPGKRENRGSLATDASSPTVSYFLLVHAQDVHVYIIFIAYNIFIFIPHCIHAYSVLSYETFKKILHTRNFYSIPNASLKVQYSHLQLVANRSFTVLNMNKANLLTR